MALDLENEYTETNPADGDYPYGSFKNATSPTDFDGTPFEKAWANDWWGFFSKLLDAAGITPSGIPDTVNTSDYWDAINSLFERVVVFDDTGSANTYQLSAAKGADPDAYTDGQIVLFKANANSTAASTIEIAALGAVSFTLADGTAITTEIKAGRYYWAIYRSGTNRFELLKAGTETQIFTTSGTYTKQPYLNYARVICVGGGGAGGGAITVDGSLGGGGGGGETVESLLSASNIAASETITVGAGGAGTGGDGGDGGNTSFGALVIANGGSGGPVDDNANGGGGGTGGSGGTGDISFPGGDGGPSKSGTFSGNGGDSIKGHGGSKIGFDSVGRPGSNFGGGGSGAFRNAGTNRAGGDGADGIVIVYEYY